MAPPPPPPAGTTSFSGGSLYSDGPPSDATPPPSPDSVAPLNSTAVADSAAATRLFPTDSDPPSLESITIFKT